MARKRGVVDYEGAQVLMQGEDDGVIIRLLKDKIEDSSVTMYLAKSPLKEMKKRKVRRLLLYSLFVLIVYNFFN